MKSLSRRGLLANGVALAGMAAVATKALAQQAPAAAGRGGPPAPPVIERFDPAFDALVDSSAKIERIVDTGFEWCEGPVWIGGADGYLLASDPRANAILQWSPRGGLQTWLKPSGLQTPTNPAVHREAGINGMTLGRGGILAADSGTPGIVRIDIATKQRTVLVSKFEGKRFNSPNDLCVSPTTGAIYFTDPPYGLVNAATPEQRGEYISPLREMPYMGVFKLAPDNSVSLIGRYLMPNGVGISPDGRTLYHTDGNFGWVRHDLDEQGNSVSQRSLFDRVAQKFANPRAAGDGMKVDAAGNIWTSGDSGIGVFNAQGQRLGRFRISGSAPNCEFGADGYLYIAGGTGLYRVAVKAKKLLTKF
jgi:gluconolactonase